MNERQIKDYQRLPQSEACRLIDFVPGRAGRWTAVGRNIIRVRFDDPEAESYTLRIASVEEGVLRIRR